jgi:large subunit ribosomal protein L10
MADYTTKLQKHKIDAVQELKDAFSQTSDFIFTDYRGLTVEQITNLRSKLREKGVTFKVVKNRYAIIALQELNLPDASEYLVGPTAVALTKADSGAAAKILFEYANESPVTVKGGIIDGNVFGTGQVEAFSKLPGRDELISMLMSAMNGPVRNLMYALNAVPQKLVRTLQAVADKKGSE